MIEQDIFVGIVAILTGLFVIASTLSNSEWVSRFWLARKVENNTASKAIILGLGAICTIIGVLLVMGFFPSESRRSSKTESNAHCPSSFDLSENLA